MSIVKSFSVGNGDMFYIQHGNSNFTIIDCFMDDTNKNTIIAEIQKKRKGKEITRFISTHPDEDHLAGLKYLDEKLNLLNFYCVENKAIEDDSTDDFDYYCQMRDGKYHYYVSKDCKRKWMNDNDKTDGKNYGSSGINFLWPVTSNVDFKKALSLAAEGKSYNNLSPIFTYSQSGGVRIIWMGDMEYDFLEKIKDEVLWPEVDILFAPHHGRDSGKVSSDVLKKLAPYIIVIGEAPSENLNYYSGYNTITQNTAKNIVLDCVGEIVHVYISSDAYGYDLSFLSNEAVDNSDLGYYIGSFKTKGA